MKNILGKFVLYWESEDFFPLSILFYCFISSLNVKFALAQLSEQPQSGQDVVGSNPMDIWFSQLSCLYSSDGRESV